MDIHRHRRLRAIFLAVCDLDDQRRAEALDDACGGDPDLRRDVEALLAADARPGSVPAAGPGPPGHRGC